jgi:hypothetical protein
MSDHSDHSVITHHDPGEGFDHGEPNVKSIWAFTVVSIVVLVLVIVALQQYFVKIWSDAVTEKVLTAPNEQLQMVRGRDDWDLTHFMYLDKKSGQVRIPVDRATDLFLQEVNAGKPFYPGKPTVPKKEEPLAAPTPAPGAAAGAPGAPAPAAPAEAKAVAPAAKAPAPSPKKK